MSLLLFAVWAVLLGGQSVRHVNAAEAGWALALVGSPQPRSPPPRSCEDVKAAEGRTVVRLLTGLEVLCDTKTDGGGWLVFQRRLSSDVDFYRNWIDYKYGFGDIRGNFWLGNENIHHLTIPRRHELRVDFTFNGKSYFAQYSKFRILGEAEKYKLEVEGYSGNAGDSLSYHNGMAFTTSDRDNDMSPQNCALFRLSAWWYNDCSHCHLNGQWGSKENGQGLTWESITGAYDSVTSVEMKLRALN